MASYRVDKLKIRISSEIWPGRSRSIIPQNNRDLNQGLLHLCSKFGDSSLNSWWVIVWTSKWLKHTQTHGQIHRHRRWQYPKAKSGQQHDCLFNYLFSPTTNKAPNILIYWIFGIIDLDSGLSPVLCKAIIWNNEGNPPLVMGGCPSQRANKAECIPMSQYHQSSKKHGISDLLSLKPESLHNAYLLFLAVIETYGTTSDNCPYYLILFAAAC